MRRWTDEGACGEGGRRGCGGRETFTLAAALRRRGFDVSMFERTLRLREQGTELGLVSLLDDIAEPTERMGFLSGRGERLAEIRLEPARRFRAPNVNVHRREELSALADAVGDEAGEFDARCVGFE